jgi:predicted DNA-binding transcriptional regulator AlpA
VSELLTTHQVIERTGIPRASLKRYRNRIDDPFPAPLKIGDHNTLWRSDDVDNWLRANAPSRVPISSTAA